MTDESTDNSERNLGGRPTKYDPTYVGLLLEAMSAGLSFTGFAGVIGVARSTAQSWTKEHPEFAEAARMGQAKRTLFLERRLLSAGVTGPEVTAAIFALKNSAPDEWREKVQLEAEVRHFLLEVPAEDANSDEWASRSALRAD